MTNNKALEEKIRQKIKEKFWNEYKVNTITLSSVGRQLAFAEGGVCWFFKNHQMQLPMSFQIVLGLLVCFFMADAIQYLISSMIYKYWGNFYEKLLREGSLHDEAAVIKPVWINRPAKFFFMVKLVFLFAASIYLVKLILIH